MPAEIQYPSDPPIQSDTVAWANKSALNNFLLALRVPDVDADSAGVVKQAVTLTTDYTVPVLNPLDESAQYNTVQVVNESGVLTSTEVVSRAQFDDVKTKYADLTANFLTLSRSYYDLVAKLKTAGILY